MRFLLMSEGLMEEFDAGHGLEELIKLYRIASFDQVSGKEIGFL